VLHKVKPVYEELPGWNTDLFGATSLDDLPPAAKDYVAFLADQVGVHIRLVGVGPGREQFVDFGPEDPAAAVDGDDDDNEDGRDRWDDPEGLAHGMVF
jgi:hypothetical protein